MATQTSQRIGASLASLAREMSAQFGHTRQGYVQRGFQQQDNITAERKGAGP
jgi:AraC-like DNA-binding protein